MTRRKIVLSLLGSVGSVVVGFGILNYVNNRIDNIFLLIPASWFGHDVGHCYNRTNPAVSGIKMT
jgi:hypothetical protein